MADTFTAEQRRLVMSHVKGRDTKPEVKVRKLLHGLGYRFRLHRKDLPGKPDIVLPKYRSVVLVHGCFWHGHPGCPRSSRPSTNVEFWNRKIDGNMARDQAAYGELARLGWAVLVVWECETRDPDVLR
ncbi:MAG: very short patch repair endonuclease, partial [Chloroflexota bacterium]